MYASALGTASTRTFTSNTLPKSYYMNVEFNEKFDKRNCIGQWYAICHHFRVTLKRPCQVLGSQVSVILATYVTAFLRH